VLNVTVQERAEQGLYTQETSLRAIMENSFDLIFMVKSITRLLLAKPL
jgi:hypothetical protein